MRNLYFVLVSLMLIFLVSGHITGQEPQNKQLYTVERSEKEWRELLTPMQFYVLREKGTERPYTGILENEFSMGKYYCAGCGNYLFDSGKKYHSGCGWPSFNDVVSTDRVILQKDTSHGMIRTEVLCAGCNGHLGHVFNDGPPPTGLRYCINSVSLKFVPEE